MRKLVLFLIAMLALFTVITHVASAERLELPAVKEGEVIYEYTGFALVYNEEHEQAEWVAYHLTAEEVAGEFERKNNFRADPQVEFGTASLDDYSRSGYDRGHLAPAGDLKWSEESMSDSFYMSNMSPQAPGFNRIIWKNLEALVRDWGEIHNEIYIVTGPVLTDGPYNTIGENEVSIPRYYYKVVLDYYGSDVRMIGFILPNKKSNVPLYAYVVSVDFVEAITGIDFFYLLPDDVEEELESKSEFSKW